MSAAESRSGHKPGRYIQPRLMTTHEAAALLGLRSVDVALLASEGRIFGVRVGRRWLVDGRDWHTDALELPGRSSDV